MLKLFKLLTIFRFWQNYSSQHYWWKSEVFQLQSDHWWPTPHQTNPKENKLCFATRYFLSKSHTSADLDGMYF